MLKKKLGIEAIEKVEYLHHYFKIPSPLTIPEGCWKVGERAFEFCKKLRNVVIPKSVKRIGAYAFYYCINADIILRKPESMFITGKDTFWGCKSVEYAEEKVRN